MLIANLLIGCGKPISGLFEDSMDSRQVSDSAGATWSNNRHVLLAPRCQGPIAEQIVSQHG